MTPPVFLGSRKLLACGSAGKLQVGGKLDASAVQPGNAGSIDTSAAWEIPGVRLVLTGEMMAARNLAWMPTLSYDTQAVLATDKVRFQGQEVAAVRHRSFARHPPELFVIGAADFFMIAQRPLRVGGFVERVRKATTRAGP